MKNIDLGILQAFFEFHLYQDRGKNGKRKRAVKCTGSLQTFRNNFTLVYRQQINEDPYIRLEKSAVHNVRSETRLLFRLRRADIYSLCSAASTHTTCRTRGRTTGR
jgi:hypothetical protein